MKMLNVNFRSKFFSSFLGGVFALIIIEASLGQIFTNFIDSILDFTPHLKKITSGIENFSLYEFIFISWALGELIIMASEFSEHAVLGSRIKHRLNIIMNGFSKKGAIYNFMNSMSPIPPVIDDIPKEIIESSLEYGLVLNEWGAWSDKDFVNSYKLSRRVASKNRVEYETIQYLDGCQSATFCISLSLFIASINLTLKNSFLIAADIYNIIYKKGENSDLLFHIATILFAFFLLYCCGRITRLHNYLMIRKTMDLYQSLILTAKIRKKRADKKKAKERFPEQNAN